MGLREDLTADLFRELDRDKDGFLSSAELRKSSLASFLLFNIILAPGYLLLTCLCLGAILADIEGWTILQGFYYVACNVTGIGPFFVPEALSDFGEAVVVATSIIACKSPGVPRHRSATS